MADRKLRELLTTDTVQSLDWNRVEHLLRQGSNPNTANAAGFTLLMAAVIRNEPKRISWLQTYAIDLHQVNGEGYSALLLAAGLGHTECIRSFQGISISGVRSVDATNVKVGNMTPLMMSALYNEPESVFQLLIMGADDELRDECGRDALFWSLASNIHSTPTSPSTRDADLYSYNPCFKLIQHHREGKRHSRMRATMTKLLSSFEKFNTQTTCGVINPRQRGEAFKPKGKIMITGGEQNTEHRTRSGFAVDGV